MVIFFLVAGSLSVPMYSAAFGDDPNITVAVITNAWKRKQDSVRTARFSWVNRVMTPKGTVKPALQEARNGLGTPIPPQDSFHEGAAILLLDGIQWRYTVESTGVDSQKGVLVPQRTTLVSSNGIGKALMGPGLHAYPLGNINKVRNIDIPRIITDRPMFFVFRSLTNGLFNPQDYVVASQKGTIENNICDILTTSATKAEKCSIWVDPLKDFGIMRYTQGDQQRIYVTVDFSYIRTTENHWVPIRWKIVSMNAEGKLDLSVSAEMKEYAINIPIDTNEFELDFPSGTWVRDFTNGSQYISRGNDPPRIITPSERSASYDQLLNSDSGEANLPPRSFWLSNWLLLGNAGLFFICLMIIIARFRRRRA